MRPATSATLIEAHRGGRRSCSPPKVPTCSVMLSPNTKTAISSPIPLIRAPRLPPTSPELQSVLRKIFSGQTSQHRQELASSAQEMQEEEGSRVRQRSTLSPGSNYSLSISSSFTQGGSFERIPSPGSRREEFCGIRNEVLSRISSSRTAEDDCSEVSSRAGKFMSPFLGRDTRSPPQARSRQGPGLTARRGSTTTASRPVTSPQIRFHRRSSSNWTPPVEPKQQMPSTQKLSQSLALCCVRAELQDSDETI